MIILLVLVLLLLLLLSDFYECSKIKIQQFDIPSSLVEIEAKCFYHSSINHHGVVTHDNDIHLHFARSKLIDALHVEFLNGEQVHSLFSYHGYVFHLDNILDRIKPLLLPSSNPLSFSFTISAIDSDKFQWLQSLIHGKKLMSYDDLINLLNNDPHFNLIRCSDPTELPHVNAQSRISTTSSLSLHANICSKSGISVSTALFNATKQIRLLIVGWSPMGGGGGDDPHVLFLSLKVPMKVSHHNLANSPVQLYKNGFSGEFIVTKWRISDDRIQTGLAEGQAVDPVTIEVGNSVQLTMRITPDTSQRSLITYFAAKEKNGSSQPILLSMIFKAGDTVKVKCKLENDKQQVRIYKNSEGIVVFILDICPWSGIDMVDSAISGEHFKFAIQFGSAPKHFNINTWWVYSNVGRFEELQKSLTHFEYPSSSQDEIIMNESELTDSYLIK